MYLKRGRGVTNCKFTVLDLVKESKRNRHTTKNIIREWRVNCPFDLIFREAYFRTAY